MRRVHQVLGAATVVAVCALGAGCGFSGDTTSQSTVTIVPEPTISWPPALTQDQAMTAGVTSWAVYLAKETHQGSDEPIVTRAQALGYDQVAEIALGAHTSAQAVFGEQPAPTTAGAATTTWVLVLFFADQASANQFATHWGAPIAGIAEGKPA